jgi:hypothetical protein
MHLSGCGEGAPPLTAAPAVGVLRLRISLAPSMGRTVGLIWVQLHGGGSDVLFSPRGPRGPRGPRWGKLCPFVVSSARHPQPHPYNILLRGRRICIEVLVRYRWSSRSNCEALGQSDVQRDSHVRFPAAPSSWGFALLPSFSPSFFGWIYDWWSCDWWLLCLVEL